MKNFNGGSFIVNGSNYRFYKVDIVPLKLTDGDFIKYKGLLKIDWLKKQVRSIPSTIVKLNDVHGVYVFTLKNFLHYNEDIQNETMAYCKTSSGFVKTTYNFAPPKTKHFPKDSVLLPNMVLYAGKAQGKMTQRIYNHLMCCVFSGERNLRLGFPKRSIITQDLECFLAYIPRKNDICEMEKMIHAKFGRYFGW